MTTRLVGKPPVGGAAAGIARRLTGRAFWSDHPPGMDLGPMGPEGLGQAHGEHSWSGRRRGSYGWIGYARIGYNGGFHPTVQRWRGCAGRQVED
jgi:hypothetical protein